MTKYLCRILDSVRSRCNIGRKGELCEASPKRSQSIEKEGSENSAGLEVARCLTIDSNFSDVVTKFHTHHLEGQK